MKGPTETQLAHVTTPRAVPRERAKNLPVWAGIDSNEAVSGVA